MTAPDLLTRCRAVLARLHHTPVLPSSSVDADVRSELKRRKLLLFFHVYSEHVTYTKAGAPYCESPSTFTLDPDPTWSTAELEAAASR